MWIMKKEEKSKEIVVREMTPLIQMSFQLVSIIIFTTIYTSNKKENNNDYFFYHDIGMKFLLLLNIECQILIFVEKFVGHTR